MVKRLLKLVRGTSGAPIFSLTHLCMFPLRFHGVRSRLPSSRALLFDDNSAIKVPGFQGRGKRPEYDLPVIRIAAGFEPEVL